MPALRVIAQPSIRPAILRAAPGGCGYGLRVLKVVRAGQALNDCHRGPDHDTGT